MLYWTHGYGLTQIVKLKTISSFVRKTKIEVKRILYEGTGIIVTICLQWIWNFNDTVGRWLSSFLGSSEGNVYNELLGMVTYDLNICIEKIWLWGLCRDPKVTFKQGYYIMKSALKMDLSGSSMQYIDGYWRVEIKSPGAL